MFPMITTRRFNAHASGNDHLRLLEIIRKYLQSNQPLHSLLITTANHSYRTFGTFRLWLSIFFSPLYLYYLTSYFDSSKSLSVRSPTESRFSGPLHRHTSIIMLYYIERESPFCFLCTASVVELPVGLFRRGKFFLFALYYQRYQTSWRGRCMNSSDVCFILGSNIGTKSKDGLDVG
jgi:hypothetical protein